jgi:hypothetical protein
MAVLGRDLNYWQAREERMNPEFARYLDAWPSDVDQARWRPAQLRQDPDGPVPDAATRATGIEVAVQCVMLLGDRAVLSVEGQDEALNVPAATVATELGLAVGDLPGAQFTAVLRETRETGQQLSGLRIIEREPDQDRGPE